VVDRLRAGTEAAAKVEHGTVTTCQCRSGKSNFLAGPARASSPFDSSSHEYSFRRPDFLRNKASRYNGRLHFGRETAMQHNRSFTLALEWFAA
jgi:hypothetical protein